MPQPAPDPKRKALGRGLDTLIRPKDPEMHPATLGEPLEIPIESIEKNPFQTRTRFDEESLAELAGSIAASGVVQPVVVRPLASGRYQLITGERRLLASIKAGKQTLPAIIRKVSDEQTLEMTIVENLQRADLNPMEQARAFQRLSTNFKLTQDEVAQRTGKDRTSVANFLRLLRLPDAVQNSVEAGELSFGHARALLSLPTPDQIASVAKKVVAQGMSVRQTEALVKNLLQPDMDADKQTVRAPAAQDANVRDAEQKLQRTLGLKVRIADRNGKGRVIIEYASVEDFDTLLKAFNERAADSQ